MAPRAKHSQPQRDSALFRGELLRWFAWHGRKLPWRRTRNPYAILVSEFMLQQTQVATVIPYYNEWMRRFPDFTALAAASEHEVLHAWQGLGYYARARNLRAAAQTVVEKHGGRFPESLDAIRDLPGVGRYTANAVLTFAFDKSVPVVEANIARLLARLSNLQIPIDTSLGRETLWQRAAELLPLDGARLHNSALMDLGALVCGTRPNCVVCPVRNFCRAEDPAKLPLKEHVPRSGSGRSTTAFLSGEAASCWSNRRTAGAGCGCCRDWRRLPRNATRCMFRNFPSRTIASR